MVVSLTETTRIGKQTIVAAYAGVVIHHSTSPRTGKAVYRKYGSAPATPTRIWVMGRSAAGTWRCQILSCKWRLLSDPTSRDSKPADRFGKRHRRVQSHVAKEPRSKLAIDVVEH